MREIDEEAVLSAISLLEAERATEVEIGEAMGFTDFKTRHLGSDWTLEDSGVYYDACQGNCSKAGAKWAKDRGLQVTFKAHFTAHQAEPSKVLVRSWCHRMQHFFNLEQAHVGGDFAFTKEMLDSYIEPAELTALARDTKKADTLTRIRIIRSIP